MFCPKCGTQIPENDHYCPTCGEPVLGTAPIPDESDHTAMFDPADAEKNRFLAALCYLNFIFIIIALLLEPNSKFLRFHINQSILLYVAAMAAAVVMIVPIVGWIAGTIVSVAVVVFTVMGIVRAIKRKAIDTPIIGKYVIVNYD